MAIFNKLYTISKNEQNWYTVFINTLRTINQDLTNEEEGIQEFVLLITTPKDNMIFQFRKGVDSTSSSIEDFIGQPIEVTINGIRRTVEIEEYQLRYNGTNLLPPQIEPEAQIYHSYSEIQPFDIRIQELNGETFPTHKVLFARDKSRQNYTPFTWSGLEDDEVLTVLSSAHPVGSIFMTFKDKHPNELMGTNWQWVRIKDAFIWAKGDDNSPIYNQYVPNVGYANGDYTARAGTPTVKIPKHSHSIKASFTSKECETVKDEHSHKPAIVNNNNYDWKGYGAWLGMIPSNGLSQTTAQKVAEAGIGQQNYSTTKEKNTTVKGSFPKSSYKANEADFFRGTSTTTYSHTHKVTVSYPTYTVQDSGQSLVGNENMPPYIAAYIWVRIG